MNVMRENGCFTPPVDVMTKNGQHIALYVLLSMMSTRMPFDVSSVFMMVWSGSSVKMLTYDDPIVSKLMMTLISWMVS